MVGGAVMVLCLDETGIEVCFGSLYISRNQVFQNRGKRRSLIIDCSGPTRPSRFQGFTWGIPKIVHPNLHPEAPTSPHPNEFEGIRGLEVAHWAESLMEMWWASTCSQMADLGNILI